MTPRIRPFVPEDADLLKGVLTRAVLEGTAGYYTHAEQKAWLSSVEAKKATWPVRLAEQITLVAELQDRVVGFMTLGYDGHLDFAYVLPDVMGLGVAETLHDRMLNEAQHLDVTELSTDASLRAQRFFIRMGWQVIRHRKVEIGDQILRNARMRKPLQALRRVSPR